MAKDPKTRAEDTDVGGFIAGSARPEDGAALCALMARVSGQTPRMWGPSIVGFGTRRYALASGKMGEICALGFSPRKTALVLYIRHADGWEARLARLGKHTTGKGCLYINKLADVDLRVLEELVAAAWAAVQPELA